MGQVDSYVIQWDVLTCCSLGPRYGCHCRVTAGRCHAVTCCECVSSCNHNCITASQFWLCRLIPVVVEPFYRSWLLQPIYRPTPAHSQTHSTTPQCAPQHRRHKIALKGFCSTVALISPGRRCRNSISQLTTYWARRHVCVKAATGRDLQSQP